MSLESFLKSIFGSKAQRDRKHYLEYVNQYINPLAPKFEAMTNDELRQTVADIRADIHGAIKGDEDRIAELKEKIETLPLDERQPLWDEIDHLEKNIKDTLEKKVYQVPDEIDDQIGRVKLAAMGLAIDELTQEQRDYLAGWEA